MRGRKATFAAGCFWGVEATFAKVEGVVSTCVGFCGGTVADPTYEEVCTGRTGHAEAVELEFDPARVSYEELLEVFWSCHDATQVDRQGPDVGSQYRSAVFFHSPGQEAAARASRARQPAAVATVIQPAPTFYPAEAYHQRYFAKRRGPGAPGL